MHVIKRVQKRGLDSGRGLDDPIFTLTDDLLIDHEPPMPPSSITLSNVSVQTQLTGEMLNNKPLLTNEELEDCDDCGDYRKCALSSNPLKPYEYVQVQQPWFKVITVKDVMDLHTRGYWPSASEVFKLCMKDELFSNCEKCYKLEYTTFGKAFCRTVKYLKTNRIGTQSKLPKSAKFTKDTDVIWTYTYKRCEHKRKSKSVEYMKSWADCTPKYKNQIEQKGAEAVLDVFKEFCEQRNVPADKLWKRLMKTPGCGVPSNDEVKSDAIEALQELPELPQSITTVAESCAVKPPTEDNYNCEQCSYTTPTLSQLVKHKRFHWED